MLLGAVVAVELSVGVVVLLSVDEVLLPLVEEFVPFVETELELVVFELESELSPAAYKLGRPPLGEVSLSTLLSLLSVELSSEISVVFCSPPTLLLFAVASWSILRELDP